MKTLTKADPREAREAGISGTVFIQFTVKRDGSIRDVHTIGNKVKGYGLEEEAIRVVKSMPEWNPGSQDGKVVNVRYNLPVRYSPES